MKINLSDLRQQIDTLDVEIIQKIQERARVVEKIGELKRGKGEPIYRPDREQEVYKKVKKLKAEYYAIGHIRSKSLYEETKFDILTGRKVCFFSYKT